MPWTSGPAGGVSADHILRHARLDGFLAVPRSRAYSCRIVITQCNELCVTQVVDGVKPLTDSRHIDQALAVIVTT